MRIILTHNLPDGRQLLVYDDGSQQTNIIAIIRNKQNPPTIIKLKEREERWKDDLSKRLGFSKKELGLE